MSARWRLQKSRNANINILPLYLSETNSLGVTKFTYLSKSIFVFVRVPYNRKDLHLDEVSVHIQALFHDSAVPAGVSLRHRLSTPNNAELHTLQHVSQLRPGNHPGSNLICWPI